MNTIKPITKICEYGKIRIKLQNVMTAQNITRYQLSKFTNTRFKVVNKWYNGTVERIDADILARFCFTLGCEVSDIIEYTK